MHRDMQHLTCTRRSEVESRALVASSNKNMAGWRMTALHTVSRKHRHTMSTLRFNGTCQHTAVGARTEQWRLVASVPQTADCPGHQHGCCTSGRTCPQTRQRWRSVSIVICTSTCTQPPMKTQGCKWPLPTQSTPSQGRRAPALPPPRPLAPRSRSAEWK